MAVDGSLMCLTAHAGNCQPLLIMSSTLRHGLANCETYSIVQHVFV
jgi:hypothetical protein